jgi:hypothetical protein
MLMPYWFSVSASHAILHLILATLLIHFYYLGQIGHQEFNESRTQLISFHLQQWHRISPRVD